VGFFVSRHLGLLLCNIAIMKRFLPLLMLTGFLFGQDVLLHKSGKNYKGRYITKENEVIIFRVEGEKDIRMFLINDVDIIIANREGAKVELYYPFNMQNNIEENDPEFWKRAAEAYLTGNKDEFLRQNTNPSPNRGYICLGSSLLFMLIAIVIDGKPSV
tara:strand:+ start:93 stop:569 length:477 start_codon:yes stop_codon:yes gene_type:complete